MEQHHCNGLTPLHPSDAHLFSLNDTSRTSTEKKTTNIVGIGFAHIDTN